MLRTRVIPCLQLLDESLVKTVRFKKPGYIGDFVNTVRIFNELEVDELCFLSIRATQKGEQPDFAILSQIASECFMPLSYGGGIKDFDTASRIFKMGFEKIVLNSVVFEKPELVTELANHFGSQSVIVSIDYKKDFLGRINMYSHGGTKKQKGELLEFVKHIESLGAGELLLTSMDQEGTWQGYDLSTLKVLSESIDIPVIVNGGAGNLRHFEDAIANGASALGAGSMVVYQSKGMGVLVNFPDQKQLKEALNEL